jgi:uroporphyrinogen-III synthase
VTGWVAQHRAVVALSSKASSDRRFKAFASLPEDRYEAFLSVPLISSGDVIGVINIHHRNPKNHSPEEVALTSYVAESLLSVPLIAGPRAIGTLNIYTREQHIFSEDEIGFAKAVAGQVAPAVENARLVSETLEMKQQIAARKVIERAKGILQRRLGISEEAAYLDLRNKSRQLRKPMRDLAEAIVLSEELERPRLGLDTASDD